MAHDGRDLDAELEHTTRAYLVKDGVGTMHVVLREERPGPGERRVTTACGGTLPASPHMGVHELRLLWRYVDACPECQHEITERRGIDPTQPDWDADLDPSVGFAPPIRSAAER